MTDTSTRAGQRKDVIDAELEFLRNLSARRDTGEATLATLQTDQRVLARVTDGIYRQPASALRELISNAYDADATEVVIETDTPRFRQIRISDNGHGMDDVALGRLIHHIGGSSKRTALGAEIGTTAEDDPDESPKGRKLIGKIGIGLFSVSQLTSHFQVITKVRGAKHRLFADVALQTYSESGEPLDGTFQSGSVQVTSIPAEDTESHGTEIILVDVRPRARDILRSRDRWLSVLGQDGETEVAPPAPPPYHSGYIDTEKDSDEVPTYDVEPDLPWEADDLPLVRMQKLFDALAEEVVGENSRPELRTTLDEYLATVWALSLSAPVAYLGKHPFDLGADDDVMAFKLSNVGRGRADPVELKPGQTVRQALGLRAGGPDPAGGFRVFLDKIELRRPISYKYWPKQNQLISQPMLFVGSYSPDLSSVPSSLRGGGLAFEGYLFWNSKILPKENNGVMARINGASGATFDDTFMKYQVSEQTRLRQVTAELFVSTGLDAALNIDRESYNFAHAHYQIVQNWVHRALRQLANTHKGIGDALREQRSRQDRAVAGDKLDRFVARTWSRARQQVDESPPEIQIADTPVEAVALRRSGIVALERDLLPAAPKGSPRRSADDLQRREQMTKAIATVLDGFGLLEGMSFTRQHELISALLALHFEEAQD
jgi:hypothetical protein